MGEHSRFLLFLAMWLVGSYLLMLKLSGFEDGSSLRRMEAQPFRRPSDAKDRTAVEIVAHGRKPTRDVLRGAAKAPPLESPPRDRDEGASASEMPLVELPRSPPRQLRGTIVMQLWGELGNNLSALAYYYAVQTIALAEFNLNLRLHVRKQAVGKADSAAANARCLKSFRDLDFDECDWGRNNGTRGRMCEMKIGRQMEAVHELGSSKGNHTINRMASGLNLYMTSTVADIRAFLMNYVSMLKDESIMQLYREEDIGWSDNERHPFLTSVDRLGASPDLVDEFYHRGLPEYFSFDEERKISDGCCNLFPDENEHVFHYRGFGSELPERVMPWGFAELRPERAADMLAASLPSETKIAFVAGRSNRDRVEAYKRAFRYKSFIVREIVGQASVQDFCFLTHARAGLWGTVQSTFVTWASVIAKGLKNTTLYGVNYPGRTKNITGRRSIVKNVHYPVFVVTDEDVW